MNYPLPGIAEVEQRYASFLRSISRRCDEGGACWHQGPVGSAGKRVDHVIHSGKDLLRCEHLAAGVGETLKRDTAGALMQQDAVYQEQRRASPEISDLVIIPDLLKQRPWPHGLPRNSAGPERRDLGGQ